MIVLDTNIVPEVMRATPNLQVISWLKLQQGSQLFSVVFLLQKLVMVYTFCKMVSVNSIQLRFE